MENLTKRKLDFEVPTVGGEQNLVKRPKIEEGTVRNGDGTKKDYLQLLERDGRSIKKLCIVYRLTGIKPLLDAIVKYCGDNIIEIELVCERRYGESRITNEYKKGLLDLASFLRGFGKRFSNLHSLKIEYGEKPEAADIKHWNELVKKMPSLRCLTIEGFTKFPLEDFIRENGQLERLTLDNSTEWRIERDLLETIDNSLRNLNYLKIQFWNAHRPMYIQPFGQTYFKNLTTLKVRSRNKEYSNVLRFLSPSANKLEEFTFRVAGELDDKTIKMLSPYKQLKRLEFGACVTNKQLPLLAVQLPQLESLTMSLKKNAVTGLGIVKLIDVCKKLTRIQLYLGFRVSDADVQTFCKPIRNKLKANLWSVGEDDGSIAIIKKIQK